MCSMCPPFWSTTHYRRHLHSLMLRFMKRCDSVRHSSAIPASTDQQYGTSCLCRLAPARPPKWHNPPDLNPDYWGPQVRLNEHNILSTQIGDCVSGSMRRRPVLLQGRCKVNIFLFVALCSLYTPKIINFGKCIHLLQAKMHSGVI